MASVRKKYLIVGTGPSVIPVKDYDFSSLPEDVIVISVNTSILFMNYANAWFSIDDSHRNVTAAKQALDRNIPVVWCLNNFKKISKNSPNVFTFKKRYNLKKQKRNPILPEEWLIRWGAVKGFSDNFNILNTGNSVYTCMNMVYLDNPSKIVILGVDGSSDASIGGNHKPNNLAHLPILFESAKAQLDASNIEVVNGSPKSIVKCFKRMTPAKAIEWISIP